MKGRKIKLTYAKIVEQVQEEILMAIESHSDFKNAHEGYAVLLEEVDELWENVKLKQGNPDRQELMKNEAIQVAAMAIRFVHDCCRRVK